MKKIIFSLTLLLVVLNSFSQTSAPTKDYYLKKSKTQKTVGWIMLVGGVTLFTVGLISGTKKLVQDPLNAKAQGQAFLVISGIGISLGSIPFLVSGKNNARKAAAISFNNQKILYLQQDGFALKSQPTLTLKIKL